MQIFSFQSYKQLLKAMISENENVRGYQTKMAAAAKCHRSYLSQLLRSKQNLNPDQAMRLATFWNFSQTETAYFVELVNLARTDYLPLQSLIKKRLEQLRRENDNLAVRYKEETTPMTNPEAIVYYSSWHYGALHMLAGLDEKMTVDAMATRLQIPNNVAADALRTLAKLGLVEQRGGTWRAKPSHIHIPRESPLCAINHSNWRQRAVLLSQNPNNTGLHYTSAQSHGAADFERIKELFLKTIDSVRGVVAPAENEETTALCIDFFRF